MKNPQIVTKLNALMHEEIESKRTAITCILDHNRAIGANIDEFNYAIELWSLPLGDISAILGDILSDYHSLLCLINKSK